MKIIAPGQTGYDSHYRWNRVMGFEQYIPDLWSREFAKKFGKAKQGKTVRIRVLGESGGFREL